MWIRQNQSWIRVQNQLEQDEIAKAESQNPFRKLPKPLMDEIRLWAREPTPTAKIMKNVYIIWQVFPQPLYVSNICPYGPDRKVRIQVGVYGDMFRNPPFVDRCERVFTIYDIPLDAEPVGYWQRSNM